MNSKKIIQETQHEYLDIETGELKIKTCTKTYKVPKEPAFIKLYLEDVERLYNLPSNSSKLLYELIKRMDYDGLISLNSTIKKIICDRAGYKPQSLDNYLLKLVKNNIFMKEGRGVYKPDPHLFGRGEWSNIYKQREAWLKITYSKDGERIITSGLSSK